MTRRHLPLDVFTARYAARLGIPLARLPGLGLRAEPCRCDSEFCEGWVMVAQEAAASG